MLMDIEMNLMYSIEILFYDVLTKSKGYVINK